MSENTPEKKIEALLGFARKAGRLAMGSSAIEVSLNKGRTRLLLLTSDASRWTARRLASRAFEAGIPVFSFGSRERLGEILGRALVAAVGVEEGQFARALIDYLRQCENAKELREEDMFPRRRRRRTRTIRSGRKR